VSKDKRGLTNEEKKLWRRLAASVKPRRPAAVETDTSAPKRAAEAVNTASTKLRGAQPAPKRVAASAPPANRAAEKRVRRGKLKIGATLDLHGYTQDSGRAALARFLHAAQARGDKTVIVVTGIGRAGEGVLKRKLPEWLAERDLSPLTSGYAQAHRDHGGAGAFYVFIKRAR